MNTKRWIALVAAAVLLLFSLGLNTIIAIFTSDVVSSIESAFNPTESIASERSIEYGDMDSRIALVSVKGTILDVGSGSWLEEVQYNHQGVMAQLDSILNDDTVKGVILEIDSPGGGVIESAEIHEKIVEIKEQKEIPIYVAMGTYAASGGYYIAAPATKIFAQKETITGSIGVIMQAFNYEKLAEKIGIEFETIKSGAHKDMFGGSRASTPEEMAMLQEIINESYEDFVDVIEQGRGMTEAEVKAVADGRILGGTQAVRAGLVDEIGKLDDAIAALRADYGLEDAELFEYTTNDRFTTLISMKVSSLLGPSQEEQLMQKILSTSNSPRMMYLYGEY